MHGITAVAQLHRTKGSNHMMADEVLLPKLENAFNASVGCTPENDDAGKHLRRPKLLIMQCSRIQSRVTNRNWLPISLCMHFDFNTHAPQTHHACTLPPLNNKRHEMPSSQAASDEDIIVL